MSDANKETQSIMQRFSFKKVSVADELTEALSGFQVAKNKMQAISVRCDAQVYESDSDADSAEAAYNEAIRAANEKRMQAEKTQATINNSIAAINTILGVTE